MTSRQNEAGSPSPDAAAARAQAESLRDALVRLERVGPFWRWCVIATCVVLIANLVAVWVLDSLGESAGPGATFLLALPPFAVAVSFSIPVLMLTPGPLMPNGRQSEQLDTIIRKHGQLISTAVLFVIISFVGVLTGGSAADSGNVERYELVRLVQHGVAVTGLIVLVTGYVLYSRKRERFLRDYQSGQHSQ
ncbi:MAG: hypothetical protein ACRDT4_16015 [Micromonosporaceae bacterium]